VKVPAILSPAAQRDLLAAVHWINRDNPNAAHALHDAVIKAARRIGEHAQVGVTRSDLVSDDFRFLVLTGFPYIIVYDAERRPPVIARILHAARDLPEVLRGL
jgi:toxin ParE1/3/4